MKDSMDVDEYGNEWWLKDDLWHREDGPAIIWENGDKEWWLNNQRHREDGPAIERANGTKTWWLYGQIYSFDEWLEEMNIPDEDKLILTLKWR